VRLASPYAVVAGVAVAGVFLVRAATGVPAAWAYDRGRDAEAAGRFLQAAQLMDDAALGANKVDALWRAGQSRLEYWDDLLWADARGAVGAAALREAAARVLAARVASAGSAWFTSALGDVYGRRARVARAGRTADLDVLARGPWALVDDDARIAIGLARTAIEREPTGFEYRDQLALLLEENGLHAEALLAIEESARVLPDFGAHVELEFAKLPRDLVEKFWQTARGLAPGDAPMLSRERQLLSTGQLGRRLGHLAEASDDLRAALQARVNPLAVAEDSFHLGLVLVDLGQYDEAEAMFAQAARHPVFTFEALVRRARIAEQRERWEEAQDRFREARRLNPRDVGVLIDLARAAQKTGNWDEAQEALRWAALIHPADPAPRQVLVELFVAKGERLRARGALDDYVRSFGRTEDAIRMERSIDAPLDPAAR
jgi:tetratricopeptide (TPR) repeat protein